MKKRNLYKYAVDLFCETLKSVTNRHNFEYKCNDTDTNCWDVFISEFGENIGTEFVKDYMLYGFQSWFNGGNGRDYSHSIRFSWIFGIPAIKRWKMNSVSTNMFITRKGGIRNRIEHKKLPNNHKDIVNSIRRSEEGFKSAYFGTARGFAWCLINTTLYFHKSVKCCNCVFKNECKEALKINYPKIYKLRGYE